MEVVMSTTQGTTRPQQVFSPLTPDELQKITRQAHAGQARALRALLRRSAQRLSSTLTGLGAAASGALNTVGEWRQRRRARAELGGLSDVMLKDIGVCRSEIPWLAQHGRSDHPSRTIGLALVRQRLPRRLAPVPPAGAAVPSPDKHAA
jgi:uncharacterized protein YjiS (DUF1127 family)